MKQILLGFFLITWLTTVLGQPILQPQLPSQGLIQQNQLWNMLVINNGDPIRNCEIQLNFQDATTGALVFKGTTGPLYIPSGVTQISQKDIGGVNYEYGSNAANIARTGGLLPIGQFNVCYSMLAGESKLSGIALPVCMPLTVQPFSPPQLAYPADRSTVETEYPVFSWIPPMPANMFSSLNFKFVLTEVNPGQNPVDALSRNPILFYREGIKDMAFPYPSSYVALEKGKTYAWQVIATNENTYSAATEVWSFSLKTDTLYVLLDSAAYPHLKRGAGSNHFVTHDKMKFSYDNEAGDTSVMINIYPAENEHSAPVLTREIKLQRGLNFIDFEIDGASGFSSGQEYKLEIINGWKENWDLKFRYQPLN